VIGKWTREGSLDSDRYVRRNPSNISLSFLEDKKVEVITGVNLPMLLKLATYQENFDLEQLAAFITTMAEEYQPGQ